jgi:hypothetical protein
VNGLLDIEQPGGRDGELRQLPLPHRTDSGQSLRAIQRPVVEDAVPRGRPGQQIDRGAFIACFKEPALVADGDLADDIAWRTGRGCDGLGACDAGQAAEDRGGG